MAASPGDVCCGSKSTKPSRVESRQCLPCLPERPDHGRGCCIPRCPCGRGTTACVFSFPTEWRIVGDLGTKDYWEVAMRSRLTIVLSLILFAASGTSVVAQNYYQPPQIGQPNMQQQYAPQPEQPPQPLPPKESGISPPPIIPPGGTLSCRPVQVCEAYGYCYWQQVCQ